MGMNDDWHSADRSDSTCSTDYARMRTLPPSPCPPLPPPPPPLPQSPPPIEDSHDLLDTPLPPPPPVPMSEQDPVEATVIRTSPPALTSKNVVVNDSESFVTAADHTSEYPAKSHKSRSRTPSPLSSERDMSPVRPPTKSTILDIPDSDDSVLKVLNTDIGRTMTEKCGYYDSSDQKSERKSQLNRYRSVERDLGVGSLMTRKSSSASYSQIYSTSANRHSSASPASKQKPTITGSHYSRLPLPQRAPAADHHYRSQPKLKASSAAISRADDYKTHLYREEKGRHHHHEFHAPSSRSHHGGRGRCHGHKSQSGSTHNLKSRAPSHGHICHDGSSHAHGLCVGCLSEYSTKRDMRTCKVPSMEPASRCLDIESALTRDPRVIRSAMSKFTVSKSEMKKKKNERKEKMALLGIMLVNIGFFVVFCLIGMVLFDHLKFP